MAPVECLIETRKQRKKEREEAAEKWKQEGPKQQDNQDAPNNKKFPN